MNHIEVIMREVNIRELERRLKRIREGNAEAWKTYGSELSVGDMIAKEKDLENQILELKSIK